MEGKEYPEHWLLADVHLKGELPDAIGILWLNDQGLLAAIPFNEPGLFRLYAVVTPDAAGNVQEASVELFQRLIAERGGDTTTKLSEPIWLSNFMVHHRMVPHYRKGHAFILLRDPEHGTHTTYGASSSCLYLVRPDGYIGFRSRTADESKLIDYLRRNFAMG